MKVLIIILATLIYQNECVSSSILDVISTKFKEVKRVIMIAFKDMKATLRNLLAEDNLPTLPEPMVLHKVKKSFSDFVDKTAAESETEHPEYLNYKSEPTALMSTPQLATLHGKRVESHTVHTDDGYLLTLHRIASTNHNTTKSNNQTVILHHGLLGSSADWILLGPVKSLPYLLSDAGYDVWMANARGNYYSRNHIAYKVDSQRYWNFSWQEIGEFDLAAAIDYIRDTTNSSAPINYVGHSMGATAFLVLLSTKPRYNAYFRIGILLAPLAFMSNIEGPMKILTTMSSSPPEQLMKMLGTGELLPSRKVPKWLAAKYCKGALLYCSNPLYFFAGGVPQTVDASNSSFVATLLYHVPAGGSTNTILHYAQVIQNGIFHRYSDVHSEFPLNLVTVPTALFSSNEDWLATIPDVLKLYFSIANPIDHYVIRDKNLSHTDFVWGGEAKDLVFSKVIEYLEDGLNLNFVRTNEVANQE